MTAPLSKEDAIRIYWLDSEIPHSAVGTHAVAKADITWLLDELAAAKETIKTILHEDGVVISRQKNQLEASTDIIRQAYAALYEGDRGQKDAAMISCREWLIHRGGIIPQQMENIAENIKKDTRP